MSNDTTHSFHPSVAAVLQYFDFRHLPDRLQATSRKFAVLAYEIATTTSGPEATVALRKLLEAKDAAVRATKSGDAEATCRAWPSIFGLDREPPALVSSSGQARHRSSNPPTLSPRADGLGPGD